MKFITLSRIPFVLSLLAAALSAACTTAPAEEESSTSEAAQTASCATSAPDGAGGVWYNFRAEDIGCPNEQWVNASTRIPAFYDGHLMQGRIRCGYEYLRGDHPEIFQSLGTVSSNETPYTDPAGFDAWYNQFSTGSKVQFEWRGPCGGSHGYLKFYVVPCNFVASTFAGGVLFESPGCGTTIRQTVVNNGQMRIEANVNGLTGVAYIQSNGVTTRSEGDFRAVQIATNQLRLAQQHNRVSAKPGAPVNWGCVVAGAGATASTGWIVAACFIPEPLEPVACVSAIAGTAVATAAFALACK